MIKIRLVL